MTGRFGYDSVNEDSELNDPDDRSQWTGSTRNLPFRGHEAREPSKNSTKATQSSNRAEDGSREAYEQRLRQELASVRRVNEAMEGVLENLDKAKNNMKVRSLEIFQERWLNVMIECRSISERRVFLVEYLDTNIVTNRA